MTCTWMVGVAPERSDRGSWFITSALLPATARPLDTCTLARGQAANVYRLPGKNNVCALRFTAQARRNERNVQPSAQNSQGQLIQNIELGEPRCSRCPRFWAHRMLASLTAPLTGNICRQRDDSRIRRSWRCPQKRFNNARHHQRRHANLPRHCSRRRCYQTHLNLKSQGRRLPPRLCWPQCQRLGAYLRDVLSRRPAAVKPVHGGLGSSKTKPCTPSSTDVAAFRSG